MYVMRSLRCSSLLNRMTLPAVAMLTAVSFLGGNAFVLAADAPPVLTVPADEDTLHVAVDVPASVKFPKPAATYCLVEADHPATQVPVQLVPAIAADGSAAENGRRLLADVSPRQGATGVRRFRLAPVKTVTQGSFQFSDLNDKSLKLSDGGRPVLVYNHGVITNENVPESDHRRSRGSYIHPVWGINGEVLTDDFPRDHYHHHGIFWTWPHIGIEGKQHDLWAGNSIHDRFVRWICRRAGPVAAVLAVENGWFVGEKQVMTERVWLRVFRTSDGTRALDIEFTWIPRDKPITLWGAGGKSYGGLTVRFAPNSREDTVITVPSGRTSDDLAIASLQWADFTSKFGDAAQPSGAAIFVHPGHPDYPPTWLTRHYGPLCVGWPGVKPQTFEPGQPIRLSYRFLIHKTALDVDRLKRAYASYTTTAKVKWEQ